MKPQTFPLETIKDAIDDGTIGFCLACAAEREGVEPDAENYDCDECGESEVFGAEQILIMGLVR